MSEEGTRQQLKLRELQALAQRLGCTLPQLAIGNAPPSLVRQTAANSVFTRVLACSSTAWCLRNDGVSAVLLGASRTEQLRENLRALQVRACTRTCAVTGFLSGRRLKG